VISSARQRARRALLRLSLTESQAETARHLLRDDRRQLEAAKQLLRECRRELHEALAGPVPDSAEVLELTLQERLLEGRERALSARLETELERLLRPEQARRLRALPPAAIGALLGRICA
jgi:Spy/CpxP family protein refolding chaperone